MGRLHDLHDREGQSPWLDNVTRGWLRDGEIRRWIDRGVRGITSNPSIFQAAIQSGPDYDEQLSELAAAGHDPESAYWELVVRDIRDAADQLAPLHADSDGGDGHVSVEVSPKLAADTDATLEQARWLWERIDRPNLMVKIPATPEGLPAIRHMTAEGRSVNVTLIFSVERYEQVMEAHLAGLEDALAGGVEDLSSIRSVASFFVSRVDTEVDRRLDALEDRSARELRSTAAVAQVQLAYAAHRRVLDSPRWAALAERGARPQRPLWASTSTKDPTLPDTLYVDALIGPGTVNTLPPATLAAFEDHGTVARTVDRDVEGALRRWDRLGELVDLPDVAAVLEVQGVAAFERSFDELLAVLGGRLASQG
jgi:transaldolase